MNTPCEYISVILFYYLQQLRGRKPRLTEQTIITHRLQGKHYLLEQLNSLFELGRSHQFIGQPITVEVRYLKKEKPS